MPSNPIFLPTLITLTAFACSLAQAATYYVDSQNGNDSWNGRTGDFTGGTSLSGPWQSLARISAANLMPGDIVKLKCGRKWTEQLTLTASGTTTAPINYTSYPDVCSDTPPSIQGSVLIPSHEWRTADIASRYIDRRLNLMPDPEFASSSTGWRTWSPNGDSTLQLSNACVTAGGYCLQLRSGTGSGNTVNYSPTFPIISKTSYRLKFSYFANVGTRIRIVMRRNVQPFDDVGVSQNYFGTGSWENVSVDFQSTREIENARLDIEIPPGGLTAKVDSVRVEQLIPQALMLFNGERTLTPAHHPNVGHNTSRPNSLYLVNAADSNRILTASGSYGSDYVTASADLTTDKLQKINAGTPISLRVTPWLLEERRVTSVTGSRIYFDRPTTYQLKHGWGFFLSGRTWMIDEPNEWANDDSSSRIYLSNSVTSPDEPIRLSINPVCVRAVGIAHNVLTGIDVQDCSIAIDATNSRNLKLSRVTLKRHEKYGVYAPGAVDFDVSDSIFSRIGMEAINGIEQGVGFAVDASIRRNLFSEIGVEVTDGKNYALPRPSRGALYVGTNTIISENRIEKTSYHGIRLAGSNSAQGNIIDSTCLALDDCGGIYGTRSSSNSTITDNIISNTIGWIEGKPIGSTSQSEGIYIDDHATGISVTGNTVTSSDHGILLHNSSNNYISSNTLFGNRRHEIWLLEDSNSSDPLGDLSGNVIENNLIFTTVSSSSLRLESLIANTSRFAHFDGNRYSSLFSPRVASESSPSVSRSLTFPEWQGNSSQAALAAAVAGRDLNGSILQSVGYASYLILSANLISTTVNAVPIAWTPWNDAQPLASVQFVSCTLGACLELKAGGSKSLVASPPFSVRGGQSYRISFDVQAPDGVTGIAVVVRRGGGGNNGFETLSPFESVTTAGAFSRYAFNFKSPKTISKSDPVTQDIGARIYFERLPAGKTIRIANLEIVETSPQDTTIRSSLLTNGNSYNESFECPIADTQPEACASYFDYATETSVTWPINLAPGESQIVYTRDLTLIDSDSDGIADQNDQCAATQAGSMTNARGCSLP